MQAGDLHIYNIKQKLIPVEKKSAFPFDLLIVISISNRQYWSREDRRECSADCIYL